LTAIHCKETRPVDALK